MNNAVIKPYIEENEFFFPNGQHQSREQDNAYTVQTLSVEKIEMTYPNGMTAEEYDREESPDYDDDDYDDDDIAPPVTGTFNYGFDPTELDAESGHRAFCNNFTD